jgi:glutamate---cysteine ligase / carboxylate-amine ligase
LTALDVASPDVNALQQRLDSARTPQWSASSPLDVEQLRSVFDGRSGSTIGMEEELMLLDPETLEVASSPDLVAALLEEDDRFAAELRHGQIEIRTPVCGNAVAAALCLADDLLRLTDRLGENAVVAASGTHPFSSAWGDISAGERYRELADEFPLASTRAVPSALHVHVAISGADRALAVYNAARSFLPELTALAANSPFLDGADTGLASSRGDLMLAFHRVGVPPAFSTWEGYVAFVEWGRRGGVFPDASHLWWDLRPHPRFGTIELRSPDSQTRIDDAAAIAALFQCLLLWLAGLYDEYGELAVHERSRIAENVWRARRYGTCGRMVDLVTGEREETRSRIRRLLEALEPVSTTSGTSWALHTASTLLADNGADRQRYVAAEHGLDGLVRWLADETVASARAYLERRA